MKKKDKVLIAIICLFLVVVSCTSCGIWPFGGTTGQKNYWSYKPLTTNDDVDLTVYVLNVEKASCIILESKGHYAIIDGGRKKHSEGIYNVLIGAMGTSMLDYVIFTHLDADHIGAGYALFAKDSKVQVEQVVKPDYENENYLELCGEQYSLRNQSVRSAINNMELAFGSCKIFIFPPSAGLLADQVVNNRSLMIMVNSSTGQNLLYVGGDSEKKREEEQVDQLDLNRDCLSEDKDHKIGLYVANHHGSKTSSSDTLLEKLQPQYSVISCRESDQDQEVIDGLKEYCDDNIYYTYSVASSDTIIECIQFVFYSNGNVRTN